MAKFTVMSRVKYKGKIHEVGVQISIEDEATAPLLEAKAVEALPAPAEKAEKKS